MVLGFFVGPLEFLIIVVVLAFLFGGKRVIEAGRGLGRGAREFKESVSGDDEKKELPRPPRGPSERDAL